MNSILNLARRNKIPIDPATLRTIHEKLSALVSADEPRAWETVISLASYRSVFNENSFSAFTLKPVSSQPANGVTIYETDAPPGENKPEVLGANQAASKETGAVCEPIGKDLNPGNIATNASIQLNGGGVILDGHHIRNAIFIGVHVVYNGGPLDLQRAVFINCQFSIARNRQGEDFVSRSFVSGPMTFDVG